MKRQPRPSHPSHRRGLTLVEVLAVVVILGLLAATLTVGLSGAFGKGRSELARTGISLIAQRVEMYRLDRGDWPPLELGLAALTHGQADASASYYLKPDQLIDPWGNDYLLVVPGPDGEPFEVLSYGADGQPGGDAEDTDISSAHLRTGDDT